MVVPKNLRAQILKSTLDTMILNQLTNLPNYRWEGVVHDTMVITDIHGNVYEVEVKVTPK